MKVRAVSWNLYLGGLDGADETRLRTRVEVLAGIGPDVLCLPESTRWDEDDERRLWWVAGSLGMAPVAMVRSHLGKEPKVNFTALLYRPDRLRLIGRANLGVGVFHHALIRAHLRPVEAGDDDNRDFLAFGTHLSYVDGESRLREARWLTDYGGPFPGVPPRAVLLMDGNIPDREPPSWDLIPQNLHSRYRYVHADGSFGGVDDRALHALVNSGWTDPQLFTGRQRAATVGYYYPNEPVPWCLDYALVSGLDVTSYTTHDTEQARSASDHLPVVCDVEVGSAAGIGGAA